MHGSTGGSWKRSTLTKATGVAHPTGKPAEHRPRALQPAAATAPALDPTNLSGRRKRLSARGSACRVCCATLGVHTAATFVMATEIGTSRASDERLMFTVSA